MLPFFKKVREARRSRCAALVAAVHHREEGELLGAGGRLRWVEL